VRFSHFDAYKFFNFIMSIVRLTKLHFCKMISIGRGNIIFVIETERCRNGSETN